MQQKGFKRDNKIEVIFLGKDNQFEEQHLGVAFRLRKPFLGGFLCNSWPALTRRFYGPTTCISAPSTRSTDTWAIQTSCRNKDRHDVMLVIFIL